MERNKSTKCTFFRESEPGLEIYDGANNGERNEGFRREDVGLVPLPWKIIYQNIRRLVTKNTK